MMPAVSVRAALAARCVDDSPPGAWRAAAAAAGVSGVDAFLCHLARSISGALEILAASAEAARVQLQFVRESRAADVVIRCHCDELKASVETAEASKRIALERELCAIDAALERLRADRAAAVEAASSLGDAELVVRYPELMARLDAAEAQLLALPTSVVEPPHVGLVVDEPAMLAGAAAFGRVVAPRAVTAADLTLEGTPTYAYPGCNLTLHLVLQATCHAFPFAEELRASLGAAALATRIEALLATEDAAPQPLQAKVSADVPGCCVVISIVIPATAPVGSSVCFGPLTMSGQPVAGLLNALRVESPYSPCPADISPEHASQLQAWLPPGGSSSPGAWEEVYRATTHGFGAKSFHTRCDGRARLLVLVRAREGGWIFGGFKAVGFSRSFGCTSVADASAFLFSLTNSLGRPEKLESKRTGTDLYNEPSWSAYFSGLVICGDASMWTHSWTETGNSFAVSASTGVHPMARGTQEGWRAAEVIAWVV